MHMIGFRPIRLSDGSIAHNVSVGNVTFHCVTAKDAIELADTFVQTIEQNTNDEARIVYYETVEA